VCLSWSHKNQSSQTENNKNANLWQTLSPPVCVCLSFSICHHSMTAPAETGEACIIDGISSSNDDNNTEKYKCSKPQELHSPGGLLKPWCTSTVEMLVSISHHSKAQRCARLPINGYCSNNWLSQDVTKWTQNQTVKWLWFTHFHILEFQF